MTEPTHPTTTELAMDLAWKLGTAEGILMTLISKKPDTMAYQIAMENARDFLGDLAPGE